MRLLVLVALAAFAASAKGEGEPLVQVEYSNPGLVPAHWTLEIHPDGKAHFRSERGSAERTEGPGVEPPDVDRDLKLSVSFADRGAVKGGAGFC